MSVFLHIDLNLFMIIICFIMYFANRSMSEKQMTHNRIFRMLILSNLALLALEAVTWMLEGRATPTLIVLYYIVTELLYLLTPLPAALWALYVNCHLFQDTLKLRTEAIVLSIPFAVSALLSLTTPLTGLMFTISPENVYQRGPFYPCWPLISFLPVVYAQISLVINRKHVPKRMFWLMLLFMLPPVLGTVVQVIFYGTTVLWSSMAISIFLVHTNLQSNQIYLDHLTGVFNRRQLDILLADRMRSVRNRQPLACILLDIDHFKAINDTLGHIAGDEALKDASSILKACIRKGDCLARFGGDEFIILTNIDNEATLCGMCQRIQDSTRRFNKTEHRPYSLNFSAGYAVYRPDSGWNKEDFIAHVDELMYRNKNATTA